MIFPVHPFLDLLDRLAVRHEMHIFPSGCVMLDIWHRDKSYVVQLEKGSAGFSEIDESPAFTTVPDERFYREADLLDKLSHVLSDLPTIA